MVSPRLRQQIFAGVLASVALLLTARWILASESATPAPPLRDEKQKIVAEKTHGKRDNRSSSVAPLLTLAILEATETAQYNGSGRNIFGMEDEKPRTKNPPLPNPGTPPEKMPSASATISLQFYGYALRTNLPRKVFLKDGDTLFLAEEGDIVDHRYKVIKIGPNSIDVDDLVENGVHTLTLQG